MRERSWVEANQAMLAAEFERLKRRVAGESVEGAESATWDFDGAPPAIDQLCEIFGLTRFERDLLLVCAGAEMDSELASRAAVTFAFAMATLADPHWSALTPARPLRRMQLVRMEGARSLSAAPLRIDERILHYLAGTNLMDARLDAIVTAPEEPVLVAASHQRLAARAAAAFSGGGQELIQLCGGDSAAQSDIAYLAAREAGIGLIALHAEDVPANGAELDQLETLLQREMLLLPAALLLQVGEAPFSPAARRLVERLPALFLSGREFVRLDRPGVRIEVDKPPAGEQRELWQAALGPAAEELAPAIGEAAAQFSLSAASIHSASNLLAAEDSVGSGTLWEICRGVSRPHLENLATRTEAAAGWEDLVLPEEQTETLHRLVSQVRHRVGVYESWGFARQSRRGLGVSALFAGESGTGKTLAAEVLACELRLDLFRIDLSQVVSKFIGETEKNLRQVFDAADDGGVLLLFDEADALFGKRAEVKDSHDRYANIEVGYLLQRMEAYQGLAVLTTNLRSSLDRAFQRRIRFVVNFPFPDVAHRETIWRRIFPAATPTSGLDYARLAQLNVAGGSIRNIALNAAFLAAEAGGPVRMTELLAAARMEAQKMERPLSTAEIRGWE